jgi:hypothetical protein
VTGTRFPPLVRRFDDRELVRPCVLLGWHRPRACVAALRLLGSQGNGGACEATIKREFEDARLGRWWAGQPRAFSARGAVLTGLVAMAPDRLRTNGAAPSLRCLFDVAISVLFLLSPRDVAVSSFATRGFIARPRSLRVVSLLASLGVLACCTRCPRSLRVVFSLTRARCAWCTARVAW